MCKAQKKQKKVIWGEQGEIGEKLVKKSVHGALSRWRGALGATIQCKITCAWRIQEAQ